MTTKLEQVKALSDGSRSSSEIARMVGQDRRTVSFWQIKYDLPRLRVGSREGSSNHQYKEGRRIDRDGYALVTAPKDHPAARSRTNRSGVSLIAEHRLVAERMLGRYLLPGEVVDHADGLKLHNAPENLRVFSSNGEHLAVTTKGQVPRWSEQGLKNLRLRHDNQPVTKQVHIYREQRKSGDVRLLQILRAAWSLGADSPYLLGTHHHTTKAGISLSSRSTIRRAMDDLCARWGWARIP